MSTAPAESTAAATVPTSTGIAQSSSCGVLWALTPIGFVGMNENEKGKQTNTPPSTEAPQGSAVPPSPINGLGPIISNLDGSNMRQLPANAVPQNGAVGQGLVLPSLGQIPNAVPGGQIVPNASPLLPFVLPYGQMGQTGGIVLPGNGALDANALAMQTAAAGLGLNVQTPSSTPSAADAKHVPGLADLHALAQLAMVQGAGLPNGDVKIEGGGHVHSEADTAAEKPAQEKGEHRKSKKNTKDASAAKSDSYAKQVTDGDEEGEEEGDSGDDGDGKKGGKPKRKRRDRSKSVWWTPEEHQKFLEGLAKFGANDSLGPGGAELISLYMGTRSVLQVRSHAQKHFLRTRTGKS